MDAAEEAARDSRLTIDPDTGRVGTWGTWVATFVVGRSGIAAGGGIRVALPNRWHQWLRNSARRLQTVDPTEAFYVTARTSRGRRKAEMRDPQRNDGRVPKGRRQADDRVLL